AAVHDRSAKRSPWIGARLNGLELDPGFSTLTPVKPFVISYAPLVSCSSTGTAGAVAGGPATSVHSHSTVASNTPVPSVVNVMAALLRAPVLEDASWNVSAVRRITK